MADFSCNRPPRLLQQGQVLHGCLPAAGRILGLSHVLTASGAHAVMLPKVGPTSDAPPSSPSAILN